MGFHGRGDAIADPVDLSGFQGWVTFADLVYADVPTAPGVYVVVRKTDDPPRFCGVAPYRGDPPFAVADLEAQWVSGTRILYIGMASHGVNWDGLRRRLRQFRRYGDGGAARHSGGRQIWQLANIADLVVGWRVTDDADAGPTEKAMIAQFRAHYGVRPFANGQD